MCGIAGILDTTGHASETGLYAHAEKMANAIIRRGPDSSGVWSRGPVGLGHRRLAIIDLSPDAAQPMTSRCGRYTIVYNGELYNFQTMRKELDSEAPREWRSRSDTEVLLEAVAHWGIRTALEKTRGMFALAIWDNLEKKLFLARDRMGEKPLYYANAGGQWLFASEPAALRAHPGFDANIDPDSLGLYLRLGCVPGERSIFTSTRKLPAGTFTVLSPDSVNFPEPQPYWSLAGTIDAALNDPWTGTQEDALERLDQLLRGAVRGQMISDVPLGALLSGGIDSSLIAAIMQAESSRAIKTFTIGFQDKAYNEADQAREVARHLGTDHTELYVTGQDALALIPSLPDLYSEPFADSSQVPTSLVCALTRKHVTVCLSGDGGDETFAGYNRHFWGRDIRQKFASIPAPLRALFGKIIQAIPPRYINTAFKGLAPLLPARFRQRLPGEKMHKLARVIQGRTLEDFYLNLVSLWPNPNLLLAQGSEPACILNSPELWPQTRDTTRWMQFMDSAWYLPDDIMVKVDRAAMGVSLESRAPFLDHKVVEFAWRLPLSMKVGKGVGKLALRKLLDRYVPRELVDRPKMGFGAPVEAWLRGPLKEWAEDLISPDRLRREGHLNPEPIQQAWKRHQSGKQDLQHRLWTVLMFQAWLDKWS